MRAIFVAALATFLALSITNSVQAQTAPKPSAPKPAEKPKTEAEKKQEAEEAARKKAAAEAAERAKKDRERALTR